MNMAYNLLMNSDISPLPSDIEEFIVGTIPEILKRADLSEAMKSLKQDLLRLAGHLSAFTGIL